jgi:hypothetical protein
MECINNKKKQIRAPLYYFFELIDFFFYQNKEILNIFAVLNGDIQ